MSVSLTVGRPWVFCGVSGVGKDSLLERLLHMYPDRFAKAISHTTRARRPTEEDGVAYHFITSSKFDEMLASGDFVEQVVVHGNMYGLAHQALRDVDALGKTALLILDFHGLEQMVVQGYQPFAILVQGPNLASLEARLIKRGDSPETIATRMTTAKNELQYFETHPEKFRFTVHNIWSIDDAFASLCLLTGLTNLFDGHDVPHDLLSLPNNVLNDEQKAIIPPFLVHSTLCFDNSHDWRHARDVASLSCQIAVSERKNFEYDTLILAALAHDLCDHKYLGRGSITEEERDAFLHRVLSMNSDLMADIVSSKVSRIRRLIEFVSWSKQDKARRQQEQEHPNDMSEDDYHLLAILRDADRLTAIGRVNGINRCRAFVEAMHPDATPENVTILVIVHCHDKLMRIFPEHFITTKHGRYLAAPLHDEIVAWVENVNQSRTVITV